MPLQGLSFRGRTVLVTGASSGIGRETALAFAAAGSNVVLLARRAKLLGKVAAEARKLGAATLVASADVTEAAAVTAAFRKAVKRFGAVDMAEKGDTFLFRKRKVSPFLEREHASGAPGQ